ncbi:MAG: helix-turn-helix domain-containing protein [Acidimicrobiaceae bacterium]|nr:helix-turn-helix domain-containing protein [Acidimicrobiaceae bacterium]
MPIVAARKSSALRPATITQSYRYALEPTDEQASLLRSHIGGARFAYDALLGLV